MKLRLRKRHCEELVRRINLQSMRLLQGFALHNDNHGITFSFLDTALA